MGCGPHDSATNPIRCDWCGTFDQKQHVWIEGDCILRHRQHTKATIGHVCGHCLDKWGVWLVEIVDLYATLREVLPLGSIPDDTAEHKHMKKTGSPAMFRLDAYALLRPSEINPVVQERPEDPVRHTWLTGLPQVPDLLSNWAQAIWDARDWGQGWPTTVTGAAAAISSNRETIAHLPDVDTFDAELKWIRRSLRNTHGLQDPVSLGHCIEVIDGKDCDGQVWPAKNPSQDPRCDACKRRYDPLSLVRLKATTRAEAS